MDAFAARHRADVVGLILVDDWHEDIMPVLPESFLVRLAELVPYDFERGNEADETVRSLPPRATLPVSEIAHGRADWIPELFGLDQSELDQAEQAWQRQVPHRRAASEQTRLSE